MRLLKFALYYINLRLINFLKPPGYSHYPLDLRWRWKHWNKKQEHLLYGRGENKI